MVKATSNTCKNCYIFAYVSDKKSHKRKALYSNELTLFFFVCRMIKIPSTYNLTLKEGKTKTVSSDALLNRNSIWLIKDLDWTL